MCLSQKTQADVSGDLFTFTVWLFSRPLGLPRRVPEPRKVAPRCRGDTGAAAFCRSSSLSGTENTAAALTEGLSQASAWGSSAAAAAAATSAVAGHATPPSAPPSRPAAQRSPFGSGPAPPRPPAARRRLRNRLGAPRPGWRPFWSRYCERRCRSQPRCGGSRAAPRIQR